MDDVSSTGSMLAVIVADDLTGACDASVHFAERGLLTQVGWDAHLCRVGAQVCAFNTGTRCCDGDTAAAQVAAAMIAARILRPRILMKKTDSLLRGNAAREIAVMRSLAGSSLAIVAPALPMAGRVVRDGVIYCERFGRGVDIALALGAEGLRSSVIGRGDIAALAVRVDEAIEDGVDALVVDVSDDADLLCLVQTLGSRPDVLWAGSSGLAEALAALLVTRGAAVQNLSAATAPILVCVGSGHPATMEQLQTLCESGIAVLVNANEAGYAIARDALARGVNVVVRFSREQIDGGAAPELAASLSARGWGGMIATGGDTAMFLLRSFGAERIHISAEVQPGIPWGNVVGGAIDGMPLITKSGGFGDADSLLDCIEFLRRPAVLGTAEKEMQRG